MWELFLLAWLLLGLVSDGYTTLMIPEFNKHLKYMKLVEINIMGTTWTTLIKPAIILVFLCVYWHNELVGTFLMAAFGGMWIVQGINNASNATAVLEFNRRIADSEPPNSNNGKTGENENV